MAEQSIKIRIGSREYCMKAVSPEYERIMRLASESINAKFSEYGVKFPSQSEIDKISFAALNQTMGFLNAKRKIAGMEEDEKALLEEMDAYLEKNEN